ncbi:metal-dependent hydrolase [Lysinibacillus endophyticus]|uniref:metal-dependent hydrolase n=1 Tax=Ureibacillus endophyticus TaxID=1978490 RepID=UPI00209CB0B6|nr:metal-dependent hydrolase [Lysinibacillus endophyticus]MCP1146212.1 metal-dependent hydrolase [Lysinibacillus endophyticus]
MQGRTHLAIGLGIGVVASVSQSPEVMPVILVATGIASLAPDLDGNNLLNKHVTKTAKLIKKRGIFIGVALMALALYTFFFDVNFLSFLDGKWFTQQNKLLLFGLGAIIIGLSVKNLETLKNILMTIMSLFLLYYAFTDELWWLVMLAIYLGGAGWFSHRGTTHTIWALAYWWYMSYLLQVSTGVSSLAIISTLAYLSHIVGDMLTKKGVKFLYPLTKKVFRIRF